MNHSRVFIDDHHVELGIGAILLQSITYRCARDAVFIDDAKAIIKSEVIPRPQEVAL